MDTQSETEHDVRQVLSFGTIHPSMRDVSVSLPFTSVLREALARVTRPHISVTEPRGSCFLVKVQ